MSEKFKGLEQTESIVTYDELSGSYSHFEIAFLAAQKAIEMIRSATYWKNVAESSVYKPPVAVMALRVLCENPQEAIEFKSHVVDALFNTHVDEGQFDEYNVDAGHLPESGTDVE